MEARPITKFTDPMNEPAGGSEASIESLGSLDQISVLVVDDDTDWASECAFSLKAVGCNPFVARNGTDALALAAKHQITIAIIDYRLQGEDGLELVEKLAAQAEEDNRQLGLIMATGHASLELAVAAMRVSVMDFLEKPISPRQLREAIQRILGVRQSKLARENLVNRLSLLSGDLQRLATLITPSRATDHQSRINAEEVTAAMVRKHMKSEVRRRELGGGVLFGDTAWTMLLDLLIAKMEDNKLSVSSACIGSGAPMSTAMRLVRKFVEAGIVQRIPDEKDRRRDFLVLEDDMARLMLEYLADSVFS